MTRSLPSEYIMTTVVSCAMLLTLMDAATATYDVNMKDEVRPTCQPLSAPNCMATQHQVFTQGRYGRSTSRQLLDRIARKKRFARLDPIPWRYNSTTFPNFANDNTPEQVMGSLRRLHPMMSTECSKYLNLFLCSVYSPVCTEFGVVPPCRELCETVATDCESVIRSFGIEWPDSVQCSLFPSFESPSGVSDEEGQMVGDTIYAGGEVFMIRRVASLTWMGSLVADGRICIPPTDTDVIGPQLELLKENYHKRPVRKNITDYEHTRANHRYGLWCPAEMRSPPGQSGYSFLGMNNCSPPCPNMYLSEGELSAVRYVILFMASLCIAVTFFTLCTFLLDMKRFRYPERPIVFYALSYFIVSVVFIIGFMLKEDAACNEEIRDIDTHDIVQGFTVVKGNHKQSCTVIFMLLYYFTVNGTIWWLILTTTWLLAAGFKWGTEAIEKYSTCYHAIAWGLPAIQTLAVVTFSKIEGDNISGVCFLGLYDSDGLRYMLLIPLCVYFVIGITILCAGFCCLNRVRIKLGDKRREDKRKISKFMLRIGVFSVLYIVPQILLLVLYAVEDSNRTRWEASWFLKACDDYRVPCPAENSNVTVSAGGGNQKPHVIVFCFKYIMTLIVALPSLFWVASKKTLQSWRLFLCRRYSSATGKVTSKHAKSYRANTSISGNALLPDEYSAAPYDRTRATFDDTDDVFLSCSRNNITQESSVSAQPRGDTERDSRKNEILQHVIQDLQSVDPPPLLEKEPASIEDVIIKQFPEPHRRSMNTRTVSSSFTTSSSMAALMHKQSSSMSSLDSDPRRRRHRKRRSSHRTSSLNRPEFKMRDAPKTAHSLGSLLAPPALGAEKPRPPPKPRRLSSLPKIQHRQAGDTFDSTVPNSSVPAHGQDKTDDSTVEL